MFLFKKKKREREKMKWNFYQRQNSNKRFQKDQILNNFKQYLNKNN